MIDTRAVAQEVQEQLLAAVHRGQEQLRKSQEQVRRSQEQVRKGREAVADAIRTGNQVVKAVRPSIPSLPLPSVRIPSLSEVTDRAKLRANVHELADHVAAAQRNLAERAIQVASPLVVEGVAKLTQVVGTLHGARNSGHAGTVAPEAVTSDPAAAASETTIAHDPVADRTPAETPVAEDSRVDAAADEAPAADEAQPAAKASKPRVARASTSKPASTGKAASTAKARTAKK
jgi:hypothetical protein